MLFQGAALFDSLPVWENVAFGLIQGRNMARAKARDIAIEKLGQVGLGPEVGKLYPAELSGGMQKRVGLARAIAADPEIIFFDEPTTGLDPIMADVINNLIVDCVKRLGATTISITHDMAIGPQDRRRHRHDLQGRDHLAGTGEDDRRERQCLRRPVHPRPRRRPDPDGCAEALGECGSGLELHLMPCGGKGCGGGGNPGRQPRPALYP